ncbi:hypothetical protein [Methanococcoides burtonii]|uniref:Uncharacterized protein n=1 Tax=Methanococcoides burtonii (strain DSM 6242 / NBRC 107633 / OCM 468 / ACE-M) TaxID=259564 RepID=Q12UA8_METBU|nr:hypothetical protein [Methanococcoides burtonii]ABE52968.1 Hypothetical protein Mbur_2094 [Methanococcoides burtonii DSM 6242]
MAEYTTIDNNKYSLKTLRLITGNLSLDVDTGEISEEQLLLCEAIDDPYILPYLLNRFYSLELNDAEGFRLCLIRVQVDSDLRLNEDIQKHQHRGYVARTIEKLLFRDIFLEVLREEGEEVVEV